MRVATPARAEKCLVVFVPVLAVILLSLSPSTGNLLWAGQSRETSPTTSLHRAAEAMTTPSAVQASGALSAEKG